MLFVRKCIIILLFFSTVLYAQKASFSSSVSVVGMSMDYREYDEDNILLDSEESSFYELMGTEFEFAYNIKHDNNDSSSINFNFLILFGITSYIGSLQGSNLGYASYVSKTVNVIMDTEIRYKYSDVIDENFNFLYGVGIGYRSWNRSLSQSQVEIYKWFSIRPSFGVNLKFNNGISLQPSVEYQHGFNTLMYESTYDYNFKLQSANIVKTELVLSYNYSNKINFFTAYEFQKQIIEKSDSIFRFVTTSSGVERHEIFEPDSRAKNQYIRFGVLFKY